VGGSTLISSSEKMDATPVTLLQRVARGNDPEAWQMLIEILLPAMLQWGRRMNLPSSDLDDVIQDLFIHLYAVLPSFQYDKAGSFRGWLRTILKRRVIDWHRRRQRLSRNTEAIDGASEPFEVDVPELEDTEFQRWLWLSALEVSRAEFADRTWRAFWEHVVHGRSAAEVAAELGIKDGSVYVAKTRVTRLLRRRFGDLLD